MNSRGFAVCFGFIGLWVLGGCAAGQSDYRLGQEAEEQGDVHRAYEYYCKAAERSPDDPRMAAALKRVGPTAATFWHSQAQIARAEGRYEDAYLHVMHCLEIRPNHAGALSLAKQLGQEQPKAVAAAKGRWLRGGASSLAQARQDATESPPHAPGTQKPTGAAGRGIQRKVADARPPRKKAAHQDQRRTASRPPIPEKPEEEPVAYTTLAPDPNAAAGGDHPKESSAPVETPKAPAPAQAEKSESEYLIVSTLSERNERHTRLVRIMDGITIKLKDTDDDGTADFDLYQGNRRVQKIRDLKLGRSKSFRGRSGKWYKLTLLMVAHDSRTVRLGILPA